MGKPIARFPAFVLKTWFPTAAQIRLKILTLSLTRFWLASIWKTFFILTACKGHVCWFYWMKFIPIDMRGKSFVLSIAIGCQNHQMICSCRVAFIFSCFVCVKVWKFINVRSISFFRVNTAVRLHDVGIGQLFKNMLITCKHKIFFAVFVEDSFGHLAKRESKKTFLRQKAFFLSQSYTK